METASILQALAETGFDGATYRDALPDLKERDITAETATKHFLSHGIFEGRIAPIFGPLAGFKQAMSLPINDAKTQSAFRSSIRQSWLRSNLPAALAQYRHDEIYDAANARPFLVIGDSHSTTYLMEVESDGIFSPISFFCLGGSAIGLANPKSKSGYGAKILAWLSLWEATGATPTTFLKFGQVDTEFVWTFRRARDGQRSYRRSDFEAFAAESIEGYRSFIVRLLETFPHPEALRLCMLFPPVLSDAEWSKGYVNGHIGLMESDLALAELSERVKGIEVPSISERTALHAHYNDLIREVAAEFSISTVDDFSPFVGDDGVVDPKWISSHEGRDHHLPRQLIKTEIHNLIASSLERR